MTFPPPVDPRRRRLLDWIVTRRTLLAAAALALAVACGQAILTAPQGSHVHMTANPEFVTANGGVSVVSVLVTEPAGTVVPDGTVVQFFTDLGRIEEQGKTNDGVARVNFTADSRSGTATVTAFAGGLAPSPDPSPSGSPGASPSPGTSPSPNPSPSASASPGGPGGFANLGVGDGEGSASITIAVGSALPEAVVLQAVPDRIVFPRSSLIRAFVLDMRGNPVQGVPVFFSVSNGRNEVLESGGRPSFTDANGFVADVLTTRAPATEAPRVVTVTATTANGKTLTIPVGIN
jgi:hypothetical protein